MNIGHRIQRIARSALLLVACLMLCLPVCAQEVVDETTTWDEAGLDGWVGGARKAILSNPGGYLNIRFKKQSLPSPYSCAVRTDIGIGVLVTNITLRFKAFNEQASSVRLYIGSGRSGGSWYNVLSKPTVGEWATYNVPVDYSAGWTVGPCSTKERFTKDMRNVAWVGVYVLRGGRCAAQDFGIDDFRVQGRTTTDADEDGMPDAWEALYKLDIGDEKDALEDSDGDMMSNFAEYRAGTDPLDAASLFEVSLMQNGSKGVGGEPSTVVITWKSVLNRTYSVLRATSLIDGFGVLKSGIPATPPVNSYEDITATDDGPYFYKIEVE